MEYLIHPALQVVLAILATITAIASAIAAWKSQICARESLNFQKKLLKHQDSLLLLRSTIELLWQIKRVLSSSLEAPDEDFTGLANVHQKIKENLESLVRTGVLLRRDSKLFAATSFGEIVDQITNADGEIEVEVGRLQSKINEILT